jgi:hypothetical protein
MSSALCKPARQTNGNALAAHNSQTLRRGCCVSFKSLDTGANFDCFSCIVWAAVIMEGDGFEVVRP